MIVSYDDYAKCMDATGENIAKAVEELSQLQEFSPALYSIYGTQYRRQQVQKQAREPERQRGGRSPVFMTYREFKQMFETMGEERLMQSNEKSPLVRMSEFSRKEPRLYQEYRARMKEEDDRDRRFRT